MDDRGVARMCSCIKESRLRERPGTSWEEGTLPRGVRFLKVGQPGPRASDAKYGWRRQQTGWYYIEM